MIRSGKGMSPHLGIIVHHPSFNLNGISLNNFFNNDYYALPRKYCYILDRFSFFLFPLFCEIFPYICVGCFLDPFLLHSLLERKSHSGKLKIFALFSRCAK